MTFVAEVNTISFLSFSINILEGPLFFIVAEGTDQPLDSPLISTKGAEKIPLPHFIL
jgi:hypothetical protein